MFQKLNQKNRTDDMPSIFILIEKKVLNLDVVLIYLSFLLDWSNLGISSRLGNVLLRVALNIFRIKLALIFAKGLESTPWKHIVVKLILPTGRQGQNLITNMPIYSHFRSTTGETSTQKKISKKFYCTLLARSCQESAQLLICDLVTAEEFLDSFWV